VDATPVLRTHGESFSLSLRDHSCVPGVISSLKRKHLEPPTPTTTRDGRYAERDSLQRDLMSSRDKRERDVLAVSEQSVLLKEGNV